MCSYNPQEYLRCEIEYPPFSNLFHRIVFNWWPPLIINICNYIIIFFKKNFKVCTIFADMYIHSHNRSNLWPVYRTFECPARTLISIWKAANHGIFKGNVEPIPNSNRSQQHWKPSLQNDPAVNAFGTAVQTQKNGISGQHRGLWRKAEVGNGRDAVVKDFSVQVSGFRCQAFGGHFRSLAT